MKTICELEKEVDILYEKAMLYLKESESDWRCLSAHSKAREYWGKYQVACDNLDIAKDEETCSFSNESSLRKIK
jgi:hypothetical protein